MGIRSCKASVRKGKEAAVAASLQLFILAVTWSSSAAVPSCSSRESAAFIRNIFNAVLPSTGPPLCQLAVCLGFGDGAETAVEFVATWVAGARARLL